jgi:hypothetical protein
MLTTPINYPTRGGVLPLSSDLPLSERSTGREIQIPGQNWARLLLREPRVLLACLPTSLLPSPCLPRASLLALFLSCLRLPPGSNNPGGRRPPPPPGAMMIARRLLRPNAPAQVIIHEPSSCPTEPPFSLPWPLDGKGENRVF